MKFLDSEDYLLEKFAKIQQLKYKAYTMFGIGFTEILLISIIAVLFLGPDKLPETMVQIAKFIKSVKKTVGDAKDTLEEEMKIADLKDEALSYKKQLDSATSELKGFKNISIDDIMGDDEDDEPAKSTEKAPAAKESTPEVKVEKKSENVTLKKRSRKTAEKKEEKPEEQMKEKTEALATDTKTFKTDIDSKEGDA